MFLKKRKKGYYLQITRTILVLLAVLVVTISCASYFITKNILRSNQLNADKELMDKITHNISMSDSTIRNLCEYMYINQNVEEMLHSKNENMEIIASGINLMIKGIATSIPYVDSIQFYNANTKQHYYTGSSVHTEMSSLDEILKYSESIRKFNMIARKLEASDGKNKYIQPVFSYFIYDSLGRLDENTSFVVINISAEWLEHEMQLVCDGGDELYIFDSDKNLVAATNNKNFEDIKNLMSENKSVGETMINGEKYAAAVGYIPELNVYAVKLKPSKIVYKPIRTLGIGLLISGVLFLAMAILMGFSAAKILYMPVGNLYKLIPGSEKKKGIDEISEIETSYQKAIEEMKSSNKRKKLGENYILNCIVKSSNSILESEIEELYSGENAVFVRGYKFAVFMLEIDGYDQEQDDINEIELLKYAVMNVASEVVGKYYRNKGVSIESAKSVIIVNIPQGDETYKDKLSRCSRTVQHHIFEYFGKSVTAFISNATEDIYEIDDKTRYLTKNMVYKYNYDYSWVLTEDDIAAKNANQIKAIDKKLEYKLLDAFADRDEQTVVTVTKAIIAEIRRMKYSDEKETLMRFTQLICGLSAKLDESRRLDYIVLSREVMSKSYLHEAETVFLEKISEMLKRFEELSKAASDAKTVKVAEVIKNIIEEKFPDSGICTAMIADEINLPARKVSKIFKEIYKTSIPEYIMQVRMNYVLELFKNNKLTVAEVAKKAGFENETYFYKLFKERFSMTPKEYVNSQIIEEIEEKE